MINPNKLTQIEYTFQCRIATYDQQDVFDAHLQIENAVLKALKDYLGQCATVSSAETRMENI